MVKNLFLTSAIILSTAGTAYAMSTPAPYVGASIGITTNTTNSAPWGSLVNNQLVVTNRPANFRGIPFSVFAGYGGVIDQNFYLAGEVFGTIATAEVTNTGLKTTYGYGASILPGVMLSDHTLAFARLGVVRSHWSVTNKTGLNSTGGQLGLGMQTSVTQCVDARMEYDYTAYRSFNNGLGSVSSPRTDAVNLALIYKFD